MRCLCEMSMWRLFCLAAVIAALSASAAWAAPQERVRTFQALSADRWEDLLASMKRVRVEVVTSGTCRVPAANVVNPECCEENGMGSEDVVACSVRSLVVEHPEKGIILVDAGLDASFSGPDASGHMRGTGRTARTVLDERAKPLFGVLYTHLHFDHVSGTSDLPPAVLYVAGVGEQVYDRPGFSTSGALRNVPELTCPNFSCATRLDPFPGVVDLLGDRSVLAVSTPGHSPGSISFVLRDGERWLFFVGDAVTELRSGDLVPPGRFSQNIEGAAKTADGILAFAKRFPQMSVLCSHALAASE